MSSLEQDLNKKFTQTFNLTTDALLAELKKFIVTNPGIREICKALGISPKDLESLSSDQHKMLEEACLVANKGTCIDEACYVAKALSDGKDPKQIDEDIQKLKAEMAVFHGLLQGPFQRIKPGVDLFSKTFEHYGLKVLDKKEQHEFQFKDDKAKQRLDTFVRENSDSTFIMNLIEESAVDGIINTHVITINVKDTLVSAFDAKWVTDIPLEKVWDMLINYGKDDDKPRNYQGFTLSLVEKAPKLKAKFS